MPTQPCLSVFVSGADNSGGMARTTKTSTGWRRATIPPPILEEGCALDSMPLPHTNWDSSTLLRRRNNCWLLSEPSAFHYCPCCAPSMLKWPMAVLALAMGYVGDRRLRWRWQWHHRVPVPLAFVERGDFALGQREDPPDRPGRLRRSVGGSDR